MKCFGKKATVNPDVSGGGRATYLGTPKRDVIVGTNGKDYVDGRGGNDRICTRSGEAVV
jgi:hypothetical protein